MTTSRHHQDQRHPWAVLTDAQRQEYSHAVDQHLKKTQAEVDRVNSEIQNAQEIIERHQDSERAFNESTRGKSKLCLTLNQWSRDWRREEREKETVLDQAHSEYDQNILNTGESTREARSLNGELEALSSDTERLITRSSEAERSARELVQTHHERDREFQSLVDQMRSLSTALSQIEVDPG